MSPQSDRTVVGALPVPSPPCAYEATSWWVDVLASVVGFVVLACDNVSMWATLSTIIGLYWLATDRHFDRHACVVLSLNFWVATAWVVLMVSLEIGVLLATVAIGLRSSVLLFPLGEGEPKLAVCCFDDNARSEDSCYAACPNSARRCTRANNKQTNKQHV